MKIDAQKNILPLINDYFENKILPISEVYMLSPRKSADPAIISLS